MHLMGQQMTTKIGSEIRSSGATSRDHMGWGETAILRKVCYLCAQAR